MLRITLEPDPTIEPGHQQLCLPQNDQGFSLAALLTGMPIDELLRELVPAETFEIPHDEGVDQNIVDLINALAHVRYQSPTLVQVTMPSGTNAPRKPVGGFVYLIRAENGLYKIGRAQKLTKRFQPFRVSFPLKWELVHSFRSADYSAAESRLHKLYADKRHTGEWFRLSAEDVGYIKSIKDLGLDIEV